MLIGLVSIDQLWKIRDFLFMFKKSRVVAISYFDSLFNDLNFLGIKIAPKADMRLWQAWPLPLYSPYKHSNFSRT
jgi:hypothetical protein